MCDWLRVNAPTIADAAPEEALEMVIDWNECGLVEDPDRTTIVLRGKTADVDPAHFGWKEDPLFERGSDRIVKVCIVADLEYTIKRWREMARTIDRVSVH